MLCVAGHGEVTYSNGNKYVGEFEKDMLHGKGVYTWPGAKQLREREFTRRIDLPRDAKDALTDAALITGVQRLYVEMGFAIDPVIAALKEHKGNIERAIASLHGRNMAAIACFDEDDDWFEGRFVFGQCINADGKFRPGGTREGGRFDASTGKVWKGGVDTEGRPHGKGRMIYTTGDGEREQLTACSASPASCQLT